MTQKPMFLIFQKGTHTKTQRLALKPGWQFFLGVPLVVGALTFPDVARKRLLIAQKKAQGFLLQQMPLHRPWLAFHATTDQQHT